MADAAVPNQRHRPQSVAIFAQAILAQSRSNFASYVTRSRMEPLSTTDGRRSHEMRSGKTRMAR